MDKPRAAFKKAGVNTLTQAMEVLYKEGFQTSEKARICIQHQDKKDRTQDKKGKTVVTELTTTHPKFQGHLLKDKGEMLSITLYDRHGNTKAGIEFRHPQDSSERFSSP